MFRSLRNLARLIAIARLFASHDALFPLETLGICPQAARWGRRLSQGGPGGRPGERLARALQQAGPTFIKLGQALSTRSDLLGDDIAADLANLQDRLAPFSGAEARAAIEAEFGKPIDALFAVFDDQAIAAASIAQVHFAVTADGREVAVKILRPGIEAAFDRDLDLFRWVAEIIERMRPSLHRLKPLESVETVAKTVALELDLRLEAAAAEELAENFTSDETFHIPAVDWQRTGRRVLTTERVAGLPLHDRAGLIAAGHDPLAILGIAACAMFHQVFRDGFFHADLHPGNLFVRADGNLAAVDFGIMGRLDMATRRHLAALLIAFLTGDFRRAAEVHFEAGWIPSDNSVEAFAQACRSIGAPILDRPQNEISIARLLAQLFRVANTFQMETQPQLLLLQKTMLVAEGTGRLLAPEANMWLLAHPLIEEWAADNLGPEARLRDAVGSLGATLERLPGMIERLSGLADDGLRLHPDSVEALRRGSAGFPWQPFLLGGLVMGLLAVWLLT